MDDSNTVYIITVSAILAILTLMTIIGNVFVIAAIILERNLRTAGNYLVLSLAVADLMVACLVMPLGAVSEVTQEWTMGTFLCDIWTSADVLCCTASILHLLAIAMVSTKWLFSCDMPTRKANSHWKLRSPLIVWTNFVFFTTIGLLFLLKNKLQHINTLKSISITSSSLLSTLSTPFHNTIDIHLVSNCIDWHPRRFLRKCQNGVENNIDALENICRDWFDWRKTSQSYALFSLD